ncbi:hypothetical protein [Ekhidna sp.]|uniref:hypothetical protein n=1 Tax=Ekhidna sp. TaxID=2608089 RepID=UPI003298AB16
MRGKLVAITLFFVIISCAEEQLPEGIYDYQVERLLSGQSGTKTWHQVTNTTNCVDSIKLVFDLIVSTSVDSLDVSMISGCSPSTTNLIGRANASKAMDRQLFSDSLIFADGTIWIVNQLTSKQLTLTADGQSVSYSVE